MDGIEEKIRDYFQHKQEVASVYLFGSRAEGRDSAASDVDIAVLLRRQYLDSASAFQEKYLV
ncbi:MAG: nucleotidyltransferase domain-containing protein, partial [Desulfosalsimonas sp.]